MKDSILVCRPSDLEDDEWTRSRQKVGDGVAKSPFLVCVVACRLVRAASRRLKNGALILESGLHTIM